MKTDRLRCSLLHLLPLAFILTTGCETPPAVPASPPFTPVADVKELMEMVIDPAADVVWESVGAIITAESGQLYAIAHSSSPNLAIYLCLANEPKVRDLG